MFGNADAIEILKAIQVLNENPQNTDIKLSDAYTLYYKGESALRPSINLPLSPPTSLYESIHRWKIFSIYFGFMEETSPGIYSWIPDNASKWSDVKTHYDPISNPNGKNYSERLLRFTEFWNNRRQETFYTSINLLMESSIFSPIRFSSIGNFANTGKTELQWVKDEIDNAFESIFLVDLKQKSI